MAFSQPLKLNLRKKIRPVQCRVVLVQPLIYYEIISQMIFWPDRVLTRNERRRVRVACTTCAGKKLRCDGQRPCGRCVNLQIGDSCEDRPINHNGQRPRRRLQTKACNACAFSKVACSLVRPCSRCVRLGRASLCRTVSVDRASNSIPRIWAYEMIPLSVALPFPQSLRQFWLNWPNYLNRGLALDLAMSPDKLLDWLRISTHLV